MKAIDTNVLVRFITGDDFKQAEIVFELFKRTEFEKKTLFIPAVVILEMIWALEFKYKTSRNDILKAVENLLLIPILHFEHQSAIQKFVRIAPNNNFDLSDLIIGLISVECGCQTVLTFDKKVSKSEFFELLK